MLYKRIIQNVFSVIGSRNLPDQTVQEQTSVAAESSSTTPPEPVTEQSTTAKLEDEAPQTLLDPANPEEMSVIDSKSSSSENQSSSSESQPSTEENQSQNTTENSKEIVNETTTTK